MESDVFVVYERGTDTVLARSRDKQAAWRKGRAAALLRVWREEPQIGLYRISGKDEKWSFEPAAKIKGY